MAASNRQSCDQIVIAVHHSFVIHQVVENPQNLRNFIMLGFFSIRRHAHLEVHLLLQGSTVELIEEALLFI